MRPDAEPRAAPDPAAPLQMHSSLDDGGAGELYVRPSEPCVPQELRLRGRRWVPQELRFHGAWWCGCGPGGTIRRCGCRGRRAVQPHQSGDFTAGGGVVAEPPGPPVSPELRLRGSRTRAGPSRWRRGLSSKSCGFTVAAQESIGRACHRSRKMPNPPLHLTRPRLSIIVAHRMSVPAVAVSAGQVSLIVRPREARRG